MFSSVISTYEGPPIEHLYISPFMPTNALLNAKRLKIEPRLPENYMLLLSNNSLFPVTLVGLWELCFQLLATEPKEVTLIDPMRTFNSKLVNNFLFYIVILDAFKAYFKQARDELGNRLLDRLFDVDGSKNKWWQAFSKRKFMGKELKD
jgi:hypothetical protein